MSDRKTRALDRIAAKIAPLFTQGEYDLAKNVLVDCCTATQRKRAGKDANGVFVYEDIPDNVVRLAAAKLILEWQIGKPISRSITADVSPSVNEPSPASGDDLLALLLAAPEAAADIVQKLKIAAEKAKRREAVDVTTTPAPEATNLKQPFAEHPSGGVMKP